MISLGSCTVPSFGSCCYFLIGYGPIIEYGNSQTSYGYGYDYSFYVSTSFYPVTFLIVCLWRMFKDFSIMTLKDVASLWFGFLIRLRRHLRLKSARDGESLGNKVISASDLEIKGNRHSILGRSFAPPSLITSE